jgi:hypothetical protein
MNRQSIHSEDLALAMLQDQIKSGISSDRAFATTLREFPSHADLLADAVIMHSVRPASLDASDLAMGDGILARVAEAHRPPPLQNLISAFKRVDPSLSMVGKNLKVGLIILRKLDLRTISVETIPKKLLLNLADLIAEPVEQVIAYLTLPPAFSPASSNSSPTAPQGMTESFESALVTSLSKNDIDQAAVTYWQSVIKLGDSADEG